MKTMTVGELKAQFSDVLADLRKGRKIVISYGKKREKVAVLLPYSLFRPKEERPLGLLKDRGRCVIHDDFKLTDEQILTS
jgi:antitoxin (DNA-binding transcriptional repressor) of toxin-antitoxin stability system